MHLGDASIVKYIGGYNQYVYDNHQDGDGTARGAFHYDPDGPTKAPGNFRVNTIIAAAGPPLNLARALGLGLPTTGQ